MVTGLCRRATFDGVMPGESYTRPAHVVLS